MMYKTNARNLPLLLPALHRRPSMQKSGLEIFSGPFCLLALAVVAVALAYFCQVQIFETLSAGGKFILGSSRQRSIDRGVTL